MEYSIIQWIGIIGSGTLMFTMPIWVPALFGYPIRNKKQKLEKVE